MTEGFAIRTRATFTNNSNNVLGGAGDLFYAAFAQGGVDKMYSETGNNVVFASEWLPTNYPKIRVTRDIPNCGSGKDFVQFDGGVNIIDRESCENVDPVSANGEDRTKSNDSRNVLAGRTLGE